MPPTSGHIYPAQTGRGAAHIVRTGSYRLTTTAESSGHSRHSPLDTGGAALRKLTHQPGQLEQVSDVEG